MFTKFFNELKKFFYMMRAINTVAKRRKNPIAAVTLVWGSVFEGLTYNWGIRFVSKAIMEGKDGELKLNAPEAIFATIPKINCILVCLENLEEATKELNDRAWAFYVIEGIAHEYRHAQQIEYFEKVGLDANTALQYLAFNYFYLSSPIEQDAVQFSRSITLTYKNGCPKLLSNYISVSKAMKEVAEEIKKQQFIDCIKRA